jgi:hypothetical protein
MSLPPSLVARRSCTLVTWLLAAGMLALAACSDWQQAPARQAIADIDRVLSAAGSAPARYIPGELKDVQADLVELKQAFEQGDYDVVLERAPQVLANARALAPTAAARAAELDQALRTEWATLVVAVPAELAAVAERFDAVATRRNLPPGVTAANLDAAKVRLRDAAAVWDRARQERAVGRLPEAVTLAHQVREMGQAIDALSQPEAARTPVK